MMIYDKHNRHVHGSYTRNIAWSPNDKVTNEDETEENIVQETLSVSISKDVSESECKIVHETLLQKNSVNVPDNVITELKDDEHN